MYTVMCMAGRLKLYGRDLYVSRALDKTGIVDLKKIKSGKGKSDKKNMHLLREGMVREGTLQATEMTPAELAMRRKIEANMKAKLRNPVIFISPTRLVVSNMPSSVDNPKLKAAMKLAAGKGSKIIECRVMRRLTQVNAAGQAHSMGYAFVEFTEHEHALAALHNANNNTLFGAKKKLIVNFSLENRNVLEYKQNRALKSTMNNPNKGSTNQDARPPGRVVANKKSLVPLAKNHIIKPKKLFPTHTGPKVRHRPRDKLTKQRQNRIAKRASVKSKSQQKRASFKKQPKNKTKEIRDKFDNMVTKYKKSLQKSGQ